MQAFVALQFIYSTSFYMTSSLLHDTIQALDIRVRPTLKYQEAAFRWRILRGSPNWTSHERRSLKYHLQDSAVVQPRRQQGPQTKAPPRKQIVERIKIHVTERLHYMISGGLQSSSAFWLWFAIWFSLWYLWLPNCLHSFAYYLLWNAQLPRPLQPMQHTPAATQNEPEVRRRRSPSRDELSWPILHTICGQGGIPMMKFMNRLFSQSHLREYIEMQQYRRQPSVVFQILSKLTWKFRMPGMGYQKQQILIERDVNNETQRVNK